ncbi:MAG: aspartate-semialdehyde dehydrogenase [Pirellulaceae bacterium]
MELPRLAVIGATGAVGTIVRELLAQRDVGFQSIRFFGSPGNRGRSLQFRGVEIPVEPLLKENIRDLDLVIASIPDDVALECAPWIVEQGGVMIDESAAHRMRSDVPLVVPEVNADAAANHNGIIASPNCSTTQLVICLQPIHRSYGIRRVVVATYQSASGAGEAARQELFDGMRGELAGDRPMPQHFEHFLPMNLIPKIGSAQDDGSTSEETKMVLESRKILGDDNLQMAVTCVRVPVEYCHSEAVFVETDKLVDAETARRLFDHEPGIVVTDDPANAQLPTPLACSGSDQVFVGRIRQDHSVENGIAFWCVSDNLRKGAATNAVQIAELLVRRELVNCR